MDVIPDNTAPLQGQELPEVLNKTILPLIATGYFAYPALQVFVVLNPLRPLLNWACKAVPCVAIKDFVEPKITVFFTPAGFLVESRYEGEPVPLAMLRLTHRAWESISFLRPTSFLWYLMCRRRGHLQPRRWPCTYILAAVFTAMEILVDAMYAFFLGGGIGLHLPEMFTTQVIIGGDALRSFLRKILVGAPMGVLRGEVQVCLLAREYDPTLPQFLDRVFWCNLGFIIASWIVSGVAVLLRRWEDRGLPPRPRGRRRRRR